MRARWHWKALHLKAKDKTCKCFTSWFFSLTHMTCSLVMKTERDCCLEHQFEILESDVSSMYSLENTIHHKTKVYGKQKVTLADRKPKYKIWLLTENVFVHQSSHHSSQLIMQNKIFQREFLQKGIIRQCGRWWMCLRFVWSLLTRMHPNVHHSGEPQLHTPAPPSKSEIGPKSEHGGVGN